MRITTGIVAAMVMVTGVLMAPAAASADPTEGPVVTQPTAPAEDDEPPITVGDDVLNAPGEDDTDLPLPPKPGPDTIEFPDSPTICDPGASWISDWTAVKASNVITHAEGYIIPEGGTGKQGKTVEFQTQIKASISYSSKIKVSAKVVEVGLEGEVGYTLAAEGSATSTRSANVETTVTKSGTHIFFIGRRRAQGSFSGGHCNSSGKSVTRIAGKMTSYAIAYQGAVWCGEKPAAGSFKANAKKYCD